MFVGHFSRWLTHAHLFSSCYQSPLHSKVICTCDPSCSFARIPAYQQFNIHRLLLKLNCTLSVKYLTQESKQYVEQMELILKKTKQISQISFDIIYSSFTN